MDAERQGNKTDLSISGIKARIEQNANHPSVSITLVIFLILDIIMLVIGCIKKDQCPIDTKIPHFLIVQGAMGIVSRLLPFINRKLQWKLLSFVIYALFIFDFVWMICGSVWVYRVYKPTHYQCNETAYLFAFWLLTIRWVLLGLSLVCGCCFCCFGGKSK